MFNNDVGKGRGLAYVWLVLTLQDIERRLQNKYHSMRKE